VKDAILPSLGLTSGGKKYYENYVNSITLGMLAGFSNATKNKSAKTVIYIVQFDAVGTAS
jgi:hypothetical protein